MFVNGMSNTWLTGTYMYSKVYVDVDYSSAIAVVIVIIGVVLSVVVNQIFFLTIKMRVKRNVTTFLIL